MYTFLSVVYVLVCSFLIMVVLLQQGRGGGMGSLGGGSQTVFGGSGAGNLLTRLTTVSAALFMILSATLAWLSSTGDSDLEDAMHRREEENRAELHEALESDDGHGGEGASDEGQPTHEEEAPAPPSTTTTIEIPTDVPPSTTTTIEIPSDLPTSGEAPTTAPVEVRLAPAPEPEAPAPAPTTEVPAPPATAAH